MVTKNKKKGNAQEAQHTNECVSDFLYRYLAPVARLDALCHALRPPTVQHVQQTATRASAPPAPARSHRLILATPAPQPWRDDVEEHVVQRLGVVV